MRRISVFIFLLSAGALAAENIAVKKGHVFSEADYNRVVGGALETCTAKMTEAIVNEIATFRKDTAKVDSAACSNSFNNDTVNCTLKIEGSAASHTSQLFYRAAAGTAAGALGYFSLRYWTGKKAAGITTRTFLLLRSVRETNPTLSPLGRVIRRDPTYSGLTLILNDDTADGPVLVNESTANNSRYHAGLKSLAKCLKEEIEK